MINSSYSPKKIKTFLQNLPNFTDYNVEYINEGVSTEVYKLTKNDKVFYFRISGEGENSSTEALAHRLLIEHGVKAPKVIAQKDFDENLKRSYLITFEIKGTSLKGTEANIEQILLNVGKQLAIVNSIPVKNFGWINRVTPNCTKLVGENSTYKDFAISNERIKYMLRDLVNAKIIDQSVKGKFLEYYKNNHLKFDCNQAYLAHGDFDLEHVFQLNGQYTGIIDWGDIRATSPYHDLSHFYTYSPNLFEYLLKGYLSVKGLEGDYMKRIEFEAMTFGLNKLYWISKNLPKEYLTNKKHAVIVLMENIL